MSCLSDWLLSGLRLVDRCRTNCIAEIKSENDNKRGQRVRLLLQRYEFESHCSLLIIFCNEQNMCTRLSLTKYSRDHFLQVSLTNFQIFLRDGYI